MSEGYDRIQLETQVAILKAQLEIERNENQALQKEIACLKADRPKPFYAQLEDWLNGSCE